MSKRWENLKDRFKRNNRDLDAEFEQFLNESLSDESLGSPRIRSPDLKSSRAAASHLPWWAEEDEDDVKKSKEIRQSWMKPQQPEAGEKESPDTTRNIDKPVAPAANSSAGMLSVDSRPDTGFSMSKDSLDERTGPSVSPELGKSSLEATAAGLNTVSGQKTAPGIDTLNELDDKKKFFQQQEEGGSYIDYGEKLHQMSESDSFSPLRTKDDKLQVTGAELGNSIFNVIGEDVPTRPPHDADTHGGEGEEQYSQEFEDPHGEGEEDYSQEFEETGEDSRQGNEDGQSTKEEGQITTSATQEPKNAVKPSMLSKVSLMDSLDSTLDRKRPVPRPRTRSVESSKEETDISPELITTKVTVGMGTSTSTGEIAELQKALRAAQMTNTDTIDKPVMRGKIDLPPTPTIIQGGEDHDTDETHQGNVKPNQMILEKTPSGETHSRGFDLQPVVAQDEGVTNDKFQLGRDVFSEYQTSGILTQPNYLSQGSALKMVESQEFSPQPLESTSIETRPRGFDLMSAQEGESPIKPYGRNYSIQPAERFGFSLQPVANLLGDGDTEQRDSGTEDEDTPPADSLRSIKSIAKERKSAVVDGRKTSLEKRTSLKKSKIPKEVSSKRSKSTGKTKAAVTPGKTKAAVTPGKTKARSMAATPDRMRFSWKHPSPSSPPSWSPTPTLRSSKQKGKRVSSINLSQKKELKSTDVKNEENSRQQLVASVESFANYLRHIVRPQNGDSESPPVKWSDDEPSISLSRTSLKKATEKHRLSREKALLKEVEKWQLQWQDEKKRNEKLIVDIAAREKDWAKKGESTRMQYEAVIHDLKQELFVLQSRLKEEEKEINLKKRVMKGGSLKGASKEELQKLEKEIREQEELLKGYQQENERLYQEIKQIQAKSKANEARMFSENQKLASELAAMREKQERRESGGYASNPITPGSAVLGAERITQLQSQVDSLKRRETELMNEFKEQSGGKLNWQQRVKELERERDAALQRADVALDANSKDLQQLKDRHTSEIDRLNRKLKWYAENQDMLDRDLVTLRRKDEEIKELKELVSRLQAQQGQNQVEKTKRATERTYDAKRIRDLERQVKEMEEIIKRRYPNSLPALIYAAASAPGQAQVVTDDPSKKQSPSYLFLENKVKKLEKELEERDEEDNKRIRTVEQKYNSMRLEYEERIKELERELRAANDKTISLAKPHTHLQDLEQELKAARENHQQKVRDMQTEIDVLREALTRVSAGQQKIQTKSRKQRGDSERLKAVEDGYKTQIDSLQEEVERKDVELLTLRQTCTRLQQQRQTMLADKQLQEEIQDREIKSISDLNRRKSPKPNPRLDQLERENSELKHRLSALSLDLEQQRVRVQASLAEAERATRQVREDAADEVEKLRVQQKSELDRVKAEYALSHSTSKVAELKSKVAGQDVVIQKLKDKLASNAVAADTLAAGKVREELLQQQIRQLQQDLRKAKEKFSPEMKHLDNLETKIFAIEQRHKERELELQKIIERTQFSAELEKRQIEEKLRHTLRQKNEEIEHFRSELDTILEVLSELKRQGVVIPVRRNPATFITD